MGLSDRDYMRARSRANFDRERPFTPGSTEIGLPWMILFWVVVAAVLFKLYTAYAPTVGTVGKTVRYQQQQVGNVDTAPRSVESRPARSADPAPARASLPTPAPAAPSPQASDHASSATNTIYLCRAYNGGTFWAQAHCNQHSALIERIAYVPPSLPFDQQVAIATQQQRSSAALINSNSVAPNTVDSSSTRQTECRALDEQVVKLDAMARQPQSPQVQDWIAARRKEARDRQFRLRC